MKRLCFGLRPHPLFYLLAAALTISTSVLKAQLGVSPSQNAAFLTELRARDPKRAEENRDVLGDAREKLELGRALSRPELFSFTLAEPHRMNADYTGFPSQYQLGRSYLTPWYDGVKAPETTLQNAAGLTAGFAFEQGFEYNSLVNAGKGGVIFSSTLVFDGVYKLAENQRVSFTGGVGFNWISGNDQIDWSYFNEEFGVALLPGTSLTYDAQFGPLSVVIYDRISLRPYRSVAQNDLGIAGTWQIAPALSWTLNYTHSTTLDAGGNTFRSIVPSIDLDTLSTILSYDLNSTFTIGLEGAYNWLNQPDNMWKNQGRVDFSGGFFRWIPDELVANGGELWNVGAFMAWNLSKNTRLRMAAGYQRQNFEDQALFRYIFLSNVRPYDRSDASEPYYSISFSQRLSDHFSHEFAAGYETNLDLGANYAQSHYVNYGLTADTWKGSRFTASSFFECSEQSASVNQTSYTSFGLDFHLAQQITNKLTAGLGYSYVQMDSSNRGAKNRQHQFGLNLSYALTVKTQVNLGYQCFLLHPTGTQDYSNHRVMLGLRYQF